MAASSIGLSRLRKGAGRGACGAICADGRLTGATEKGLFRGLPGAVAQLVERLVRNEEVRGSTPLGSTISQEKQSP